jgi:hypothetical protein
MEKNDFEAMNQNFIELKHIQEIRNDDPKINEQIDKSLERALPNEIEKIRKKLLLE